MLLAVHLVGLLYTLGTFRLVETRDVFDPKVFALEFFWIRNDPHHFWPACDTYLYIAAVDTLFTYSLW